jgi:pseudo-rSAM protein
MKMQFWFYVEPYVHLACKSKDCLLYNTLTGKALIYWNDPDIAGLVRRLSSARNSRVIRLDASDFEKKRISTFVRNLREHFMGDVLDTAYSSAKPVQMVHRPKIEEDAERLKREKEHSVGERELAYLSDVSFYINTECRENCPGCRGYLRQFLCCTRSIHKKQEMTPSTLSHLLSQIEGSPVSRISILGGDIFLHSQLQSLVEILKAKTGEIAFYLHYSHLAGPNARMDLLNFDAARYQVMVTPPYSPDLLRAAWDKIVGHESRTTFVFVVQSDADIQQSKAMIKSCGEASYTLKPYFNGENSAFFHESVFMDIEDVLNARSTHKEIYANQVLNRLNFGRLTVMSNGKVYANLNNPALGNWKKDSILQILYKEMYHGKSWRRTRLKVKPCRHCILAALCPPLGNYEFALKRNDLCHMREGKEVTKITSD